MKSLLLAAALAAPVPAGGAPAHRWDKEVAEAADRFSLPPDWIYRVIAAESDGRLQRLGRPIVSPAGAMGLMQLMPGTWREMSDALSLGTDPNDPRDNILAGTAYLRAMYDRFGYPGLFAAYNAGPGRYAEHLATGRPLPIETKAYVARLTGEAQAASAVEPISASPSPVLVALGPSSRLVARQSTAVPGNLFVSLRTASAPPH